MATYRAICDLFLPGSIFCQAGTFITDQVPAPAGYLPIPVGWIPAQGVDPIDSEAVGAFWNQGPVWMKDAEIARAVSMNGNRWSNVAVTAPNIYWTAAVQNGVPGWVLHGATGFGFKST